MSTLRRFCRPDVTARATHVRLTNASRNFRLPLQITGPLIRVVADRFAWQVKVAILETLKSLIGKVGPQLKAFLPQLQTTFVKVRGPGIFLVRRPRQDMIHPHYASKNYMG
jgi:hypothetical protein